MHDVLNMNPARAAQFDLFASAANERDGGGEFASHYQWTMCERRRDDHASYCSLVEQIPAVTYIVMCSGGIDMLTFVSPQISALGYSPAEWLANPALHGNCIHPDDRIQATRAIAACRANGAALSIEYRMTSRDGRTCWYRDEAMHIRNAHGERLRMQGVLIDITPQKLAAIALESTQVQLRAFAARQEQVKEVERMRIARELHDELGGLLVGMKACISVASHRRDSMNAAPDPMFKELLPLIDEAIATVSRVATDLRPSILDHLGIWAALEWQAHRVTRLGALECECHFDPRLSDVALGSERESMLFRILQEALTNVVRHARAQRVVIKVLVCNAQLLLSVHDDGIGLPLNRAMGSGSWGTLGMAERAGHFGGAVSFSSGSSEGTTVLLELPLGEAA